MSTTTDTTHLTWQGAQDAFAAALDGYEQRDEQTALATAIEGAFTRNGHLLAQAGCGVGKSYGSLIPAIGFSHETGKPVIYATATKALQTQISEKDLPFLRDVLSAAGHPFTFEVIKGRGNYLCQAKLAEATPANNPHLHALSEELDSNPVHTGDLDTLITSLEWYERANLTAGTDECPGRSECAHGETCFSYGAQDRAKVANVVVVNHSVLVVDAALKSATGGAVEMLPDYAGVIVDEGHNLEDYTTSALGSDLSANALSRLGAEVSKFSKDPVAAQTLDEAADLMFTVLATYLGRDRSTALTDAHRLELEAEFTAVLAAVKGLRYAVSGVESDGSTAQIAGRKRLHTRIDRMQDRILSVITARSSDLVRWLERDERRGVLIKYAPLSVAEFLSDNIWNTPAKRDDQGAVVVPGRPRAAVVMSATLAIGSDFSFLAGRLGVTDAQGFDAGSPFSIEKQARLYVPATLAHPSKESQQWRAEAQTEMRRLVLASGGGALLLFTSTKAMREAHAALVDSFEMADLQVLMQGDGRNNRELSDTFNADVDSVLFALKSFMEGVDFKGPTCRLVIVDKLPFAVPDDVMTKARADAIDVPLAARLGIPATKAVWHREGSFATLSRPVMTLILIQAIGRLIRTRSDRGLVAILDPRLRGDINKSQPAYGKVILRSLPPAPVLDTRDQAIVYLEELAADR